MFLLKHSFQNVEDKTYFENKWRKGANHIPQMVLYSYAKGQYNAIHYSKTQEQTLTNEVLGTIPFTQSPEFYEIQLCCRIVHNSVSFSFSDVAWMEWWQVTPVIVFTHGDSLSHLQCNLVDNDTHVLLDSWYTERIRSNHALVLQRRTHQRLIKEIYFKVVLLWSAMFSTRFGSLNRLNTEIAQNLPVVCSTDSQKHLWRIYLF